LNTPFLSAALLPHSSLKACESLLPVQESLLENGIITSLTTRVSKKLLGFIPLLATYTEQKQNTKVLLKSKALDEEVIKGLHMMAASIDPSLSDLIKKYMDQTEYRNCHLKEIKVYEFLEQHHFVYMPAFHGSLIIPEREIFFLIQELMNPAQMHLINAENTPELWSRADVEAVISAAVEFHELFKQNAHHSGLANVIQPFAPWQSAELYNKLLDILSNESQDVEMRKDLLFLSAQVALLKSMHDGLCIEKTYIHNDFNPRNVAIRGDGMPVIYDWELVVEDIPHRDIVEFLSFVLPEHFEKEQLLHYLKYHYEQSKVNSPGIEWTSWLPGYRYALLETLICRFSFYEVAGILVKYEFSTRVFKAALRMLKMLS
ncbi:MAG TPA: phosphotransferase, partial [Cytophagales bacterium]|nr:phosphotransferase [Cytophagales bacterium]